MQGTAYNCTKKYRNNFHFFHDINENVITKTESSSEVTPRELEAFLPKVTKQNDKIIFFRKMSLFTPFAKNYTHTIKQYALSMKNAKKCKRNR